MNRSFETKTAYVFGAAGNFWLLFMAVAVVLWLSPFFMEQEISLLMTTVLGAISFLIGICLRFSYHGVEIDAEKRMTREFTSILGYRTGEWEPLPDLKKLRFTSYNPYSPNTPNGISPTFRHIGTMYRITLVSDTALTDYSISLSNRKHALKSAQALAELLHLQVEETHEA